MSWTLILIFVMAIGVATSSPTIRRIRDESSAAEAIGTTASSSRSSNAIDVGLIEPTTTTPRPIVQFNLLGSNTNGFGIGAAAGVGGLGASAGLGSFQVNPRSDPFLPFGAFAGINLPNSAGRIGAGCSGLNCGVQLGEFVLQVPNIVAVATNRQQLQQQQGNSFADAVGTSSSSNNNSNQTSPQIIRNRNDPTVFNSINTGNTNTIPLLEQGQSLIRNIFGGIRDFRTTFAGLFREPERSTTGAVNSVGLTTTTTGTDQQQASNTTTTVEEPKNNVNVNNGTNVDNAQEIPKKVTESENEVISS